MIEDKLTGRSEVEGQEVLCSEPEVVDNSHGVANDADSLKDLLRVYNKDTQMGIICCIVLAGLCAVITNLCSRNSILNLLPMLGVTFGVFEVPVITLISIGLQSESKIQSSIMAICTVYLGIILWSLLHRAFLGICPWDLISVLVVVTVLSVMIAVGEYRRDNTSYTFLGSRSIVGILSAFIAGFGVFFCMSPLVLGILGDNLAVGNTLFFGLQGFIICTAINSHSVDCLKSMFDNWTALVASIGVVAGLIVCCFACGLSSSQLVFVCVIVLITMPVVMVTQGIVKIIERIPKHD